MAKKKSVIRHMGMTMSEAEHEKWHKEHPGDPPELSQVEHDELMKQMGVSEEEHEKWHISQGSKDMTESIDGRKPTNPFAVGGGFLTYCVKQGWLDCEGSGRKTKYYATDEGIAALAEFGIEIER